MKIAKRLQGISASPTMAVMQQAQELRRQGVDIIDLGPGEPDFPTPAPVKQAGIDAIANDFTRYTPSAGIKELRQQIAEKYNQEWGTDFSAANVVVTCGAKHAIYDVCMALFEEGDEVLNPAPYWVTFPEVVKMTGAVPIDIPTREDERFILSIETVRQHLGPKVRGIIVNTPNNPSGAVIPGETIRELAELARGRDFFVLFDETYEYFTYGETPHVSLASFLEKGDANFALVGSFSKTFSMTGWRIGYLVAPMELAKKISEFQSHQTGNPPSMGQQAALHALKQGTEEILKMKEEYRTRRALVLKELKEIPGFSCPPPDGAFYAFPNVSQCMAAAGIKTSQEFSSFLLEKARVATVPGSAFGMEGYIRISYATSMENLEKAFSRIKEAVSQVAPA
ncbi:MAG TPA: pyridoxal phosphate-dependent aminotransferase [Acidobacteriota bacterium]|nr:pyridoxal phosphate-dependent aminotransferase [Acidobacteriota bacterium]